MKHLVCLLLALAPVTASADRVWNEGSGGSHDCNKDKNAVVNAGAGKYTITGACDRVVVNGAENTVTIESVKNLSISGADNKVDVGAVERASVSGNSNTLNWKKALGGNTPKVSNTGSGNKINQTK